jgi:hypothetical protein
MSLFAAQVTGEALAAAAVETVLSVTASASKRLKVRRWGVSFNGTNVANTPVQVQLIRLTADGSSATGTPKKMDEASENPLAAFRSSYSAEPSTGDILESHYVSPAGGQLIETYFDDAPVVGQSGRLGIRVQATLRGVV